MISVVASARIARVPAAASKSTISSRKTGHAAAFNLVAPTAAPTAGQLAAVASMGVSHHLSTVSCAAAAPADAATATPAATQPPTAIITGASSGLGLNAANALSRSGYHVVMACRDFAKAKKAAQDMNMDPSSYTVMHLDLASLDSVRQFADAFKASGRRLDCLVCNAAVYLPTAKEPTYTPDGFELSVGTNHLGHFLLANLLLPSLEASPDNSPAGQPRMIIVGSITGNTNTMAGNVPPKADLGAYRRRVRRRMALAPVPAPAPPPLRPPRSGPRPRPLAPVPSPTSALWLTHSRYARSTGDMSVRCDDSDCGDGGAEAWHGADTGERSDPSPLLFSPSSSPYSLTLTRFHQPTGSDFQGVDDRRQGV